jgi:hypothetical protein
MFCPVSLGEKNRANIEKRNFRFYSILGFTSTLMCTWEAMLACVHILHAL